MLPPVSPIATAKKIKLTRTSLATRGIASLPPLRLDDILATPLTLTKPTSVNYSARVPAKKISAAPLLFPSPGRTIQEEEVLTDVKQYPMESSTSSCEELDSGGMEMRVTSLYNGTVAPKDFCHDVFRTLPINQHYSDTREKYRITLIQAAATFLEREGYQVSVPKSDCADSTSDNKEN